MKKTVINFLTVFLILGFAGCLNVRNKEMTYFHGPKLYDKFISILDHSPEKIELKVRNAFPESYLYHIILNEEETRISEKWNRTQNSESHYKVLMEAKDGFTFKSGEKYRLCVGFRHPDDVAVERNFYQCYIDYEFVLD